MERFEVGKTYVTHDWFTGGTLKYTYEGKDELSRGIFSIEDFELDGEHYRTELYDILEDIKNNTEYILLGEYQGHSHCIYAKENWD